MSLLAVPRGWCGGGLTDRVEQGKPELLGVLLVALHLQRRAERLARTVGPRAQQRRLAATGRRRDDRHLPRRRAIQGGEKITPVDQPGSCPTTVEMPALLPAPDALPPATQSSRYQASVRAVNGAPVSSCGTILPAHGGEGGRDGALIAMIR